MIFRKIGIKNSVFSNFLLSYICVLLLPIIIGSLLYSQAVKIVESHVRDSNLLTLQQARQTLDSRLNEVDSTATQLAFNNKMKYLANVTYPIHGPNIYKLREASKSISSYGLTSNFISDIHICFKNSSTILTPKTSYVRLPLFYGHIFKYGSLDYDVWKREFFGGQFDKAYLPAETVIIDGKKHSMVVYAQSIPLKYPNIFLGNVFIFIDEKHIQNPLRCLVEENNGWAYIADSKGNIISSVSRNGAEVTHVDLDSDRHTGYMEQNIHGRDMFVTYTVSSYNDWKYVAAVPVSAIQDRVQYIRTLTWGVASFIFVSGILIAFFLAKKNYKPIRSVMNSLVQNPGDENNIRYNAFEIIQDSIKGLIHHNKMLQNIMYRQKSMVTEAFFDRLLRGEFEGLEQINETLRQNEIKLEEGAYVVLLASVEGYNSSISEDTIKALYLKRKIVKDALEQSLDGKGYFHDIDIDKIAIVFSLTVEESQDYKCAAEKLVSKASEQVRKKYGIRSVYSGGSLCENLADVYLSFGEAKRTMASNNIFTNDGSILWSDYSAKVTSILGYYYPVELELRLINCVKGGNFEQVQRVLGNVYAENFVKRNLSYNKVQQLVNEMYGTLEKSIGHILIEDPETMKAVEKKLFILTQYQTAAEMYNCFIDLYFFLCNIVSEKKNSHNHELIENIIEYINKYYTSSDLCLKGIADHFARQNHENPSLSKKSLRFF